MSKPSPVGTKRGNKVPAHKKVNAEAAIVATLNDIERLKPKTAKAARMLDLLKSWLGDKSGYDEQSWPKLKNALERQRKRVGGRKLFDG
jgi:hypothetical protein